MTNNLIVFVDGLPYNYLEHARFLDAFPYRKGISPGVGFSVNIKPELLAGLTPDDVGYFCEWGVRNTKPPLWQESLAVFQFTTRWPVFDRVVHKILNRLGFELLNIPFGYLRYFDKGKNKSAMKHFTEAIKDEGLIPTDYWPM